MAEVLCHPDWEHARSPQLAVGGGRTNRDGAYDALPRGEAELALAGYVYFPYEGKLSTLKRV